LSNINRFVILDDDNNHLENEDVKEQTEIKKTPNKSWADYSDEENFEEKNLTNKIIDEEYKARKEFENSLTKLTSIKIIHDIRKYDKLTKTVSTIKNERELKVVTKQSYESLKKLIGKLKTHNNNNKFNYKEQKDKIKFANQLLQWCYKDSGCFIYPVAIIKTNNGKSITRNSVKENSNSEFSIIDMTYFVPYKG
jgi:DNA primase